MTHEVWRAVLAKEDRDQIEPLERVASAITAPQVIQEDPVDPRYLLYYGEWSEPVGKLLCVPVKCLPHAFAGGEEQREYVEQGAEIGASNLGEAWVASAYFLDEPKSRAKRVWP